MSTETERSSWLDVNQRYLSDCVAAIRNRLEFYTSRTVATGNKPDIDHGKSLSFPTIDSGCSPPPALTTLCALFGLSHFERDVLLLCVGMEFDASFPRFCAVANGDPERVYPTFSLALAALPEPHWSALTPHGPLRRWHLIEASAGQTLALSPLRVDERILHYLAGISLIDERLGRMLEPVRMPTDLVPSHWGLTERIVTLWGNHHSEDPLPIVQLCGAAADDKRDVAASCFGHFGLRMHELDATDIPALSSDLDLFIRLWTREAALGSVGLLLNCDECDQQDPARAAHVARFLQRLQTPIVVSSHDRWTFRRPTHTFDVRKPTSAEQHAIWEKALGTRATSLNGDLHRIVSQFGLSSSGIQLAMTRLTGQESDGVALEQSLWEACRAQMRPRLDSLAQRIESSARWTDLVLPEMQLQALREIAGQVHHKATVYDLWGSTGAGSRGLGISALFAGPSGTGKTMAAEVLANTLRLDLYRVDLSSVVSKYIGETEKNLRAVFDAADDGGVILLFDEADALFGKRSEVKDSHDRYANVEVSYLLQRMEAYRGLAILTTNLRKALDQAFLRRIRFVVEFPFPDHAQRIEIWRRVFPASLPQRGLDLEKLARLGVAGGSIRNIALNAAFLAAEQNEALGMAHLLRAARTEYGKLDKPMTEAETGDWEDRDTACHQVAMTYTPTG